MPYFDFEAFSSNVKVCIGGTPVKMFVYSTKIISSDSDIAILVFICMSQLGFGGWDKAELYQIHGASKLAALINKLINVANW